MRFFDRSRRWRPKIPLLLGLLLLTPFITANEVGAEPTPETLVAAGGSWRYLDDGSDQAGAWREVGFDDSGWASGNAELGYGDGDEATVVGYGGDPNDKHVTTYFRHSFDIADPSDVSALDLGLRRDDGAVVYLNGTEVARTNLPAGPIGYRTFALTWQISETAYVPYSPSPGLLRSGTNTIAVEVHQAWITSSDISFDLTLNATTTTPPTTTTTTLPTTTTTTLPPDPPAGPLLAAGDIARCNGTGHEAVADVLDGQSGAFLPLGDVSQDSGTTEQYEDCYDPRFGVHKPRTRPVPGNHDYYTLNAEPYYDYFGSLAGAAGEGWYSYDIGNWHIIAINSNCDWVGGCEAGSPQYEWLAADLAASNKACLAAYWHHSRWSSEQGYHEPTYMGDLFDLLATKGADFVLGGHAHVYERFARMNAAGEIDPSGVRVFVVGTGGTGLRDFGPPLPGSEARNSTDLGLLRVHLDDSSFSWEFLPVAGGSYTDSGTDTC